MCDEKKIIETIISTEIEHLQDMIFLYEEENEKLEEASLKDLFTINFYRAMVESLKEKLNQLSYHTNNIKANDVKFDDMVKKILGYTVDGFK